MLVFLIELIVYPVLLLGMLGSYAKLRKRFAKSKCCLFNGCTAPKVWSFCIVAVAACCMGKGLPGSICSLTDLISILGYMAFFALGCYEVYHHRRAIRQWFFAKTRDDD